MELDRITKRNNWTDFQVVATKCTNPSTPHAFAISYPLILLSNSQFGFSENELRLPICIDYVKIHQIANGKGEINIYRPALVRDPTKPISVPYDLLCIRSKKSTTMVCRMGTNFDNSLYLRSIPLHNLLPWRPNQRHIKASKITFLCCCLYICKHTIPSNVGTRCLVFTVFWNKTKKKKLGCEIMNCDLIILLTTND